MQMYNLHQAFKQSDGAADNFHEAYCSEGKRVFREKISMNIALEDKMCDLYDLYIQVFFFLPCQIVVCYIALVILHVTNIAD